MIRWTEQNRHIVPFNAVKSPESDFDAELRRLYKTPTSTQDVVTNQTLAVELNRHNYSHKMHKLLQLEELTRSQIIARCVRISAVIYTSKFNQKARKNILTYFGRHGCCCVMVFQLQPEN